MPSHSAPSFRACHCDAPAPVPPLLPSVVAPCGCQGTEHICGTLCFCTAPWSSCDTLCGTLCFCTAPWSSWDTLCGTLCFCTAPWSFCDPRISEDEPHRRIRTQNRAQRCRRPDLPRHSPP